MYGNMFHGNNNKIKIPPKEMATFENTLFEGSLTLKILDDCKVSMCHTTIHQTDCQF